MFHRELPRSELLATCLLQAASLPFLLTISQIGIEMGLLERTTAAALVAAGIVSVLVFPPIALRLLASASDASLAQPVGSTVNARPR